VPIFLSRWGRFLHVRLSGWRLPLAVVVFVFVTSWPLMLLAEPASSKLTDPANYWWYFVVTAATVGYGDFFPETPLGHLVGAYVIVGGIATLTVLFTQLSSYLETVRSRRLRGAAPLYLEGHVVLLGYHPGRTERIVSELTAEPRVRVALCAWEDVGEHPMPEHPAVHFVRGDLTREDVMERAAVARASTVVIDGRDDNETLAIAVVVDHADPDVHVVAALRDLRRSEHLRYVNPRMQTVQWHVPYLLAEEALDPGITQIYNELMTSGGTGNTYSLRLPRGFPHRTFGDCQVHFGRRYGATLLAVRDTSGLVISPDWDTPLDEAAVLYYLAGERIEQDRLSAAGRGDS
jgi:voltage-gated potassium channel